MVIYLVNVAKMRALNWGGCWVNLRTNRRGVGLKVPLITEITDFIVKNCSNNGL